MIARDRAVADHHQLSRRPAAQPGHRGLRGDGWRRRGGRFAAWRAADQVPIVAVGAVRCPDRDSGGGRGAPGAGRSLRRAGAGSRLTEHAGYSGQLLGPMLVTSFGLGLLFVPLALVALHNVADERRRKPAEHRPAGRAARSAWPRWARSRGRRWPTTSGTSARPSRRAASPAQIVAHVLATGFSRGFLVAAGIAVLASLVALATIRVRRQDLTGAGPAPSGAAPSEAGDSQPRHCAGARAPRPPLPRQFAHPGTVSLDSRSGN